MSEMWQIQWGCARRQGKRRHGFNCLVRLVKAAGGEEAGAMREIGSVKILIQKTGDDSYLLDIPANQIVGEELDGPKLLAMLGREELTNITAEEVLSACDSMEPFGFMELSCKPRL